MSLAGIADSASTTDSPVGDQGSDALLNRFTVNEFTAPPVVWAYGPRNCGLTTLLASLVVQVQQREGGGLDGVVVVTSRPRTDGRYMGDIFPGALVVPCSTMSVGTVLSKLVVLQRHWKSPDRPALRLAVVADDAITVKEVRSLEVQSEIQQAAQANIALFIGTTDLSTLTPAVQRLATHVMASKCMSTDDPKALKKHMFVMFPKHAALSDVLNHLDAHEFLVGKLTPGLPLTDVVKVYKAAVYSTDGRWPGAAGDVAAWSGSLALPEPTADVYRFAMAPELIAHIAHTLAPQKK